MNPAAYTLGLQVISQLVSPSRFDDIKMINRLNLRIAFRRTINIFHIQKQLAVHSRDLNSLLVPLVKPLKLNTPNRRVNRVQTRSITNHIMLVLRLPATIPKLSSQLRYSLIISYDHSSVATNCHVFRRIKRKAAHVTDRPSFTTCIFCAVSLTRILNHLETMILRYARYLPHVARVTIKMNRKQSLRALRNFPLHFFRVNV